MARRPRRVLGSMSPAASTPAPADASEERSRARRAVIASTVGTAIEWYDFYVYGLIAALVFNKQFFPQFDPFAGLLLSFSTFFVGFAARPLGAVIFGHLGDRWGRKSTLVATLLLMGGSTVLVGVVPGYSSIGVWGAVALTVLRAIQGVGTGGEWGGAVLVATEWSRFQRRRGFIGAWPQWGSPVGLILATGAVSIFSAAAGPSGFLTWGWRIPFLLSGVLIAVGLYIRLGLSETQLFANLHVRSAVERLPVLSVLRTNWREVVLTCLARMCQHASFYVFTTFMLAYGTGTLALPRGFLLGAQIAGAALSLFTCLFFGALSDRVGRKRLYLVGIVAMFVFSIPYFLGLESRWLPLVGVAIVISLVIGDVQYGPQAALIAENFPTRVRYSGASLGYQLSSLTSAGPATLVAATLTHVFGGGIAVGVYLMVLCVIAFAATLPLRDGTRAEIDPRAAAEPAAEPAAP